MSAHESTLEVERGSLYVVATPIGHLGDLSARAARVLAQADYVAAEDTRVSAPLVARLSSRARLIAAHQHNEAMVAARIVGLLAEGLTVALITDAGTPGISDPGARIVSTVLDAGQPVVPIPGPSAVTAIASASGLIEGAFRFEGFLPSRPRQRDERLRGLASSDCPIVVFEAPHRIEATLAAIASQLGSDRWLALGRELTKKFEEIHRCLSGEAVAWVKADPMRAKGEYALVLAPAGFRPPGQRPATEPEAAGGAVQGLATTSPPQAVALTIDMDRLLAALVAELGVNRAARIVEQLAGRPHREVYQRALRTRLADENEGLDAGGGA